MVYTHGEYTTVCGVTAHRHWEMARGATLTYINLTTTPGKPVSRCERNQESPCGEGECRVVEYLYILMLYNFLLSSKQFKANDDPWLLACPLCYPESVDPVRPCAALRYSHPALATFAGGPTSMFIAIGPVAAPAARCLEMRHAAEKRLLIDEPACFAVDVRGGNKKAFGPWIDKQMICDDHLSKIPRLVLPTNGRGTGPIPARAEYGPPKIVSTHRRISPDNRSGCRLCYGRRTSPCRTSFDQ